MCIDVLFPPVWKKTCYESQTDKSIMLDSKSGGLIRHSNTSTISSCCCCLLWGIVDHSTQRQTNKRLLNIPIHLSGNIVLRCARHIDPTTSGWPECPWTLHLNASHGEYETEDARVPPWGGVEDSEKVLVTRWRSPARLYFVSAFVCFRSFYFEALPTRQEVDVHFVTWLCKKHVS